MKRFLISIFIAFVLGNILLVVLLTGILLSQQDEVEKVFTIPETTKILCLGSSHTGCTWKEGEGVYSIWANGSAFMFSLMRLKELDRKGQLHDVKYCIIDADYEGICGRMKESCTEKTFLESLPFSWRYLPVVKNRKWRYIWSALTWIGHRRSLKSSLPAGSNLYVNMSNKSRVQLLEKSKVSILRDMDSINHQVLINRDFLIELKNLCEAKNIKLILFAAPLVSKHPLRCELRNMLDEWKMILEKENVEYWDLRDEMEDHFFYDINHLSVEGRELITKKYLRGLLNE